MKLAIVIVNYKDEARTISYIKEEITKIRCPHRIVIVNNSATVESDNFLINNLDAVLITNITNKPVESQYYVISHAENLGFAKGNNLGAEFCYNHFPVTHFLFTNNDIRFLNNDLVERMLKKLDTLNNVGMIGPKVLGLEGENQSPEPYYPFWHRYFWMYWLSPFLSSSKKRKIFKLDYSQQAAEGIHYKIMGSFFIVNAADFKTCGMMDPNTFLFAEEIILSERLKSINKKAYYFPEVAILHEHGKTILQHFLATKYIKLQFKSESYYYRKYKGVSMLSIFLGRLSLNLYLKLKFTD